MAGTILLLQPHSLQLIIYSHCFKLAGLLVIFSLTLGLFIAEQRCWLKHSASLQGLVWCRGAIANQQGVIRNSWPILPRPGLQQPTSWLGATRTVSIPSAHRQLWPEKEIGPVRARACFAFCGAEQEFLLQACTGWEVMWGMNPTRMGLARGMGVGCKGHLKVI